MTSGGRPFPRYEGVAIAPMMPSVGRAVFVLDFAEALAGLRSGRRVARAGWGGGSLRLITAPRPPAGDAPNLAFESPRGGIQADWSASPDDLLAEDWGILAS